MIEILCPKCRKPTEIQIEEKEDEDYLVCSDGCWSKIEPETTMGMHDLIGGFYTFSHVLREPESED